MNEYWYPLYNLLGHGTCQVHHSQQHMPLDQTCHDHVIETVINLDNCVMSILSSSNDT